METRARYILIGTFALAVIVAGFGFAYWMNRAGGLSQRATYQIRFENSAAGLQTGAPVEFNGIRVGEVTALRLDEQDFKQVLATIAVAKGTPVRADTKAGLEFQGLMGTAAVSLDGGSASSPEVAADQAGVRLLIADPLAGQTLTQTAREAMQRVNRVLSDNSDNLKYTLGNLKTFSDALARNSGRLDSVMAGLEKMAGGGPVKPPPELFDLAASAVAAEPTAGARPQIVILEPTAAGYLQTQQLLKRSSDGKISKVGDVQWADLLPKLVQGKLLQAFENAGYPATLAEPLEHSTANHQLTINLRSFEVDGSSPPAAKVAFSAKIVAADGHVIGARIFQASVPSASMETSAEVAALNSAFNTSVKDLLAWMSGVV